MCLQPIHYQTNQQPKTTEETQKVSQGVGLEG